VISRPMQDKNDCLLRTQGFRHVILAPTVHEKHLRDRMGDHVRADTRMGSSTLEVASVDAMLLLPSTTVHRQLPSCSYHEITVLETTSPGTFILPTIAA
jgi:hypothetical protein